MEKENMDIKKAEDVFAPLKKAIEEAKLALGKKCEHCGCYGGIHKSNCLFMLKLE